MSESTAGIRLFTLAEANATLPLVRAIVADIMPLAQSVLRTKERLDSMKGRGAHPMSKIPASDNYRDEVTDIEARLADDIQKLNECIDELRQIGVEPKVLTEGLVDFPAMHNGELVNLCWKYGEDEIRYWHTLEGGFAGRQPVGDLTFAHPNANEEDASGNGII